MQERRAAPTLSAGHLAGTTRRRWALAALVAAMVVAGDQTSKSWAEQRLAGGPVHVVWKLDFELTYNTGSSFGLARGWAPVIGGVAVVLVVVLASGLRHVRTTGLALSMGLVLGGALGNLADRIFRGHHGGVVDFIALHFWPTFNVADSCIVVGALLAAWEIWRTSEGRASPADAAGSS